MPSPRTTYMRNLARHGFGVQSRLERSLLVQMLHCRPDTVQSLPPPRLAKLAALSRVTFEPEAVGPAAAHVFSAQHSVHRRIMLDQQEHLGQVSAEAVGLFTALPDECIGAKPWAEAAGDRVAFRQRLLLIAGTTGRKPLSFQEHLARRGIASAAKVAVNAAVTDGFDLRICALPAVPAEGVRVLRTVADLQAHGAAFGNGTDTQGTLEEVASGDRVFFEVDVGERTYAASMPNDGSMTVDRVERRERRAVSDDRFSEVAYLVAQALAA